MEPTNTLINWLLGAVGAAFLSMAGAVGMLWKLNETKNARDIETSRLRIDELQKQVHALTIKSDQCEADRAELRVKIGILEERLK